MGVESLSFMMLTLISWDHDMTYFFRTFIIMIGTCLLQGNYTCLSILSNLLFTSINWPIKNKKLKEKKKKKKKKGKYVPFFHIKQLAAGFNLSHHRYHQF
jgi:hypothetical protein